MIRVSPARRLALHMRPHPRSRLRAAALYALALGVLACSRGGSAPAKGPVCNSRPVVFVHGLGQSAAIFDPAIGFLRSNGIAAGCLHAINLRPPDGDNIRAAEDQIAPFIAAILTSTNRARAASDLPPLQKVDLVSHSMGALSGRWYAAILHPEQVATFISTSGANHGTDWHCSAPYGDGHRQMCPAFARSGSGLQLRLNGAPGAGVDETPYGLGVDSTAVRSIPADAARSILYVTLSTEGDPYIVPAASLVLDGAGADGLNVDQPLVRETSRGNFVLREPSGHDELLSSPAALRWLLQVIRSQP